MRLRSIAGCLVLAAGFGLSAGAQAGFTDSDQDRLQRWQTLEQQIFGTATLKRDDAAVALDVPERALDAALVPVTIRLAHPEDVRALYLVIDDNPSPVAAHFTFGRDIDPREIKLRVRVNTYTSVHAIAEMKGGGRVMTAAFVKASGGCSAPMGVSDEEAMRGMGDIKGRIAGEVAPGKPVEMRLMIRHPNFNGMQMNETTRDYTPARYIEKIGVTFQDVPVFSLESDISLASNPVLVFALKPHVDKGTLKVDVKDSQNEQWDKSFPVPSVEN